MYNSSSDEEDDDDHDEGLLASSLIDDEFDINAAAIIQSSRVDYGDKRRQRSRNGNTLELLGTHTLCSHTTNFV
jgi:hypothetical protein